MPGRFSSRVFVGRSFELAEFDAAHRRAAQGDGATILLVGGEAGVGKTRLLAELFSRARDAGSDVLVGHCADLRDAAIPLLPIAEALGTLAARGGGVADEFLANAPPELTALGRGAAPGVRIFAPLLELLRDLSMDAPVVLALEDVHWADRSTLDLLTFLASRVGDERLMLVVTFRSDEADWRDDLRSFLAEAVRRPCVQRLEVARLSRTEADVQLAHILGAPPPRALADAVFARSEGNPLFAEELAAVAAQDDAEPLPDTLREMLLVRIAGLDASAQDVVRAAAVGGRRVHHLLLSATSGLDEPQLTVAIRQAVLYHVLHGDGDGLAFRHPLLQEAAYSELVPGERARLHAAYGRALQARPELAGGSAATVAAELAHHWWHAGDRPQALTAAVAAGMAAESVPAHAEAAEHFGRALQLWDAVPDAERRSGLDRAAVLARAAEATAWSGSPERAVELAGAALALLDEAREPVRVGLLRARRGWYLWWLSRPEESVLEHEAAVRLIGGEPPSIERAWALATLAFALLHAGRLAEARDCCEHALAAARRIGDRGAEARALGALGHALHDLRDVEGGVACMRQSQTLAREIGDPELMAQAAAGLSDALRRHGRLEEALALALESVEECHRAGLDLAQGSFNALNAAETAFELGRWELTASLADQVLADPGSPMTLAFAHHLRGLLASARGDLDAARAAHDAAKRHYGPDLGPEPRSYVLGLEAELAALAGRPAAAADVARRACDLALAVDDQRHAAILAAIGVRAEADCAELARAGRDDAAALAAGGRARALSETARAIADDHDALRATVEAEVARGVGGSDPPLWQAAAQAWDARGCPYPSAYARWRWAEALLGAPGGRGAATAVLRDAREVAERLDAKPLLGDIDALARRARVDLSPADAAAPDAGTSLPEAARELGLTARELEVLEHVALGQTNREIAGELFISARTAGVHVSHILEKLGASTRTEAAATAHRLGLAP